MTPTQYELATLAATIPIPDCWKDGEDSQDELVFRANRAFDLWRICGQVIADAPAMVAAMVAKSEERLRFYSQFPKGERVALEDFLKIALPGKSSAARGAKWQAFRTRGFSGEVDPENPGHDSDQFESRLISDRRDGFSLAELRLVFERFKRFADEDSAQIASRKGAKAAAARHSRKQAETDAKRSAAKNRTGRGYVAPEPGLSSDEIARKVVAGLAKSQERRNAVKKRLADGKATKSTPKQAPEARKQDSKPAGQTVGPRKQKK
jgi:hypothetical protein